MSRFDDYLRDIPLEIDQRFYPKPQILLPLSVPPRLFNAPIYNFEVEHRARRAYESRNDLKESPKEAVPVEPLQMLHLSPSTSSLPNQLKVLQPSRVDNSIVGIPVLPPEPKPVVSFEEFESKGTVFDEVEWKSIDDRKALSQILNGHSKSEPTTPAPIPAPRQNVAPPVVNLPSYPSLSHNVHSISFFAQYRLQMNKTNDEAQSTKIINGSTVAYTSPNTTNTPTISTEQGKEVSKIPLKQRLLSKGYREHLVNVAMAKVPRQRIVHIEYYMKGMSTLEKRGVSPEESLKYLLDSGVTDKQDILQRAQAADQILLMGFANKDVLDALLKTNGDQEQALYIIMP